MRINQEKLEKVEDLESLLRDALAQLNQWKKSKCILNSYGQYRFISGDKYLEVPGGERVCESFSSCRFCCFNVKECSNFFGSSIKDKKKRAIIETENLINRIQTLIEKRNEHN